MSEKLKIIFLLVCIITLMLCPQYLFDLLKIIFIFMLFIIPIMKMKKIIIKSKINKNSLKGVFKKKEKIINSVLISLASGVLVFLIMHSIFEGFNQYDKLFYIHMLEIILPVCLSIYAYLTLITKYSFEIYEANLDYIDKFIFDKTGFERLNCENINIRMIDDYKKEDAYFSKYGYVILNEAKYCYSKNINGKECDIVLNFYVKKSRRIKVIRKDIIFCSEINGEVLDKILLGDKEEKKYSFLLIDTNVSKRIYSCLRYTFVSHKMMLAYIYSILNFANEVLSNNERML